MRENNTGLCQLTGKAYSELAEYFWLSGDETCLLASDTGQLRVLGDHEVRYRPRQTAVPPRMMALITSTVCTVVHSRIDSHGRHAMASGL